MLEVKPRFRGRRKLHVGAASVEPGTGAVRGIYGGQDYLDSQINWAVEGGQAGSTFKPFALTAGLKAGYALKDIFDGNSPIDINGTEFENQGDESYGRRQPHPGHRGLHQHRLHRPHQLDARRPAADHRHRERDGHPGAEPDPEIGGFPTTRPGSSPTPASRSARRR